MKFQIVSDSSCDLSEEFAEKSQITLVSFYVSFDGNTYEKEGKELQIPQFYQKMAENPNLFPKTSMPSVQDYMDAFLPLVQKQIPVLCICLNAKFSGSMQSALNAREEILEEYPQAQIHVMNSRMVTVLQGQFVEEAILLRDKGYSLKEAVSLLEDIRDTGYIFFTTKDLSYLEHGGRIGKAAALAGTILNVKPILAYYQQELLPLGFSRGRKKSLKKLFDLFVNYLKENAITPKEYRIVTGYGYDLSEYHSFSAQLWELLKKEGFSIEKQEDHFIGATIGVHTGPYPIGIGVLKRCLPE